jgi:hypothetical protein
MQSRSQGENYRVFIRFVEEDLQNERQASNRRLLNVVIWCLILPTFCSLILLGAVQLGFIPVQARGYLDWMIPAFPALYALYLFFSEMLAEVPNTLKRGGLVTTLEKALKEGLWRERVCEALQRLSVEDWDWVVKNFEIDLQRLKHRIVVLTALGGAVFFLIIQGVDSLTGSEPRSVLIKNPVLGLIDVSAGDVTQLLGLGVFLVLVYLSGDQTHQSLLRYLNCAELVKKEKT